MGRLIKLAVFILVFSACNVAGQVFFDQSKTFYSETDALLIPTIHFGYGLKQYDFIDKNTGLDVKRKNINPELYVGCQLLSNGFMVGVHYGILQNTIMTGIGFNIPIHLGKKKKKSN